MLKLIGKATLLLASVLFGAGVGVALYISRISLEGLSDLAARMDVLTAVFLALGAVAWVLFVTVLQYFFRGSVDDVEAPKKVRRKRRAVGARSKGRKKRRGKRKKAGRIKRWLLTFIE